MENLILLMRKIQNLLDKMKSGKTGAERYKTYVEIKKIILELNNLYSASPGFTEKIYDLLECLNSFLDIGAPGYSEETCIGNLDKALRGLHSTVDITFIEASVQRRYNLLIVEDQALIALANKLKLEEYGFAVTRVLTGEQAIKAADDRKFDLVLMDIDLGKGISGIQAAEKIREKQMMPIIFLTCQEPDDYDDSIKAVGNSSIATNKYITKKFVNDIKDRIMKHFFDTYIGKCHHRQT